MHFAASAVLCSTMKRDRYRAEHEGDQMRDIAAATRQAALMRGMSINSSPSAGLHDTGRCPGGSRTDDGRRRLRSRRARSI